MQCRDLHHSLHVFIWCSTNWTSSSWSFLFDWHKKTEHLKTKLVVGFYSDLTTMHEYLGRSGHIIWQIFFRCIMNFGGAHNTSRTPEGRSATFRVQGLRFVFSSLFFNIFGLNCCTIYGNISHDKINFLSSLGKVHLGALFSFFFLFQIFLIFFALS